MCYALEVLVNICTKRGGWLMRNLKLERLRNQKGATAIEYALVAALIAVAIVTAATSLGTKISGTFDTIKGKLP